MWDQSAPQNTALLTLLKKTVGTKHVLTHDQQTRRFRKGHRYGEGPVLAVTQPANLVEQWRVLEACINADCIVIMQAANTGLTGGSTPFGTDYDRPVVLINTQRMNGIQVINQGEQVVCLPGATLDQLEKKLKPFNREPHSVIGSSCIGASVLGGVCNNSGGALVRRGPAYTELALYAQVREDGQLHLVNHLGIRLGEDPETILQRLENGDYSTTDIEQPQNKVASDPTYAQVVREVDADTPARFNANPDLLFEASGSAGKLCLFAVRLDTFPSESSQVFYIGTNRAEDLTAIRRHLLTELPKLPIAGEYIHRTAFEIGEKYGKDTFLIIDKFGTAKVPAAFALKNRVDGFLEGFGLYGISDKILQACTALLPHHLPAFMRDYRDRFEHHLVLRVADDTAIQTLEFLKSYFLQHPSGAVHQCTATEGSKAFLHRFAIAGAAIRYKNAHRDQVEDIVALDIALRRNDRDWVEQLPADLEQKTIHKLYYGHFFCHVFHQDYIVKKGVDPLAYEHRMWDLLDERKAEYPAEHNVGHLYIAKPALAEFYQQLDPTNSFNPGIGHTSKLKAWGYCCEEHQGMPSTYGVLNKD